MPSPAPLALLHPSLTYAHTRGQRVLFVFTYSPLRIHRYSDRYYKHNVWKRKVGIFYSTKCTK
jgi:hypothetical protein